MKRRDDLKNHVLLVGREKKHLQLVRLCQDDASSLRRRALHGLAAHHGAWSACWCYLSRSEILVEGDKIFGGLILQMKPPLFISVLLISNKLGSSVLYPINLEVYFSLNKIAFSWYSTCFARLASVALRSVDTSDHAACEHCKRSAHYSPRPCWWSSLRWMIHLRSIAPTHVNMSTWHELQIGWC
jgi:hypothetical protein